jgi:hypothetical protein
MSVNNLAYTIRKSFVLSAVLIPVIVPPLESDAVSVMT